MRQTRKITKPLATVAAIAFLVSTSASSASSEEQHFESLGTAEGNEEESSGLTVEANAVTRNDSGNLVSVTWSIENATDDYVQMTWLHDQSYTYSGPYFSGVTAINSSSGTIFHPVMDGNGECLCAGNTSGSFFNEVAPGGKTTYWSLFSTPSDVETLTLEVPGFEPIEDIPID